MIRAETDTDADNENIYFYDSLVKLIRLPYVV
jgi:hypothetical protein